MCFGVPIHLLLGILLHLVVKWVFLQQRNLLKLHQMTKSFFCNLLLVQINLHPLKQQLVVNQQEAQVNEAKVKVVQGR